MLAAQFTMSLFLRVLPGLCLCTGFSLATAGCEEWRQVLATTEGPVFHRCMAGSPIEEVMIKTHFRVRPERLYALVTDYEVFEQFIPNVLDSRVLERTGPVQWVYHRLHFPGPVADRVYVMKSVATVADTSQRAWRVEWVMTDRIFPQADLTAGVRPDRFSGFWEIGAAGDDELTEARYAVHSDPGGLVPAWLVGRMTDRYVQQVVAAIRRRLGE